MKISVIIPTFNRLHTLKRAIHSVLSQTFLPEEVIVVDDGSSDGTCQWVARQYPQAGLLKQNHQGVSAARNKGINQAKGNWIALLDSDDEWLPHKLEKQVQTLKNHPDYLVCHTDEIWIRNGVRVNPMNKHTKPDGWIYEKCLPLCCVSPSSILLKKALLINTGGFDEHLPVCEDYDLWLRLFSQYPIKLVSDKLLIKYGGHEDQLSTQFCGMDRFRVDALIKVLCSGQLDQYHYQRTVETLITKLDILIKGCLKHGKFEQSSYFKKIRQQWTKAT